MERIRRSASQYQEKLLALPNVCGVGVGRKRVRGQCTDCLAVVVFVEEKVSLADLPPQDAVPQTVGSVRTDVIPIGEIRLLGERTDRYRPLQGGVSVGHYKITAGTLGAIVYDNKTNEPWILSNNHVLANSTNGTDGRAKVGDPIYQPGPYDGGTANDQVAVLSKYVPMIKTATQADCQIAKGVEKFLNGLIGLSGHDYSVQLLKRQRVANKVDCALARPVNRNLVTDEIIGIGQVKGTSQAKVGDKVKKSGRTTGLTQGEIIAVDAVLQVKVGERDSALYEDQIVTSNMSQGGDSGSVVFNEKGEAVGLLFAGSDKATICNRIDLVLKELDVHFQ
jgi:hypothetical protein